MPKKGDIIAKSTTTKKVITNDNDSIDISDISNKSNKQIKQIKSTRKTKSAKETKSAKPIKSIKGTKETKLNKSTSETKSTKSTKLIKGTKETKSNKKTKSEKEYDEDKDNPPIDVNRIVHRNPKKGSYIMVIVESPAKIVKLGQILGPGYVIASSVGHIMDLHQRKMSVDIENNFEPSYYVIKQPAGNKNNKNYKFSKFQDKQKIVNELISKASKASKVILASDKDREGEMIAWSYKVILGLSDDNYDRITFTSITKDAIKNAIANPGKIDMLMVDSQKARRILDRVVGFKVSPRLTQILGLRNLSAGRVQSVVVKLICEKEQEITKFFEGENASFFKIAGAMKTESPEIEMKCDLYTEKNSSGSDGCVNDCVIENDLDENDDENADSTLKKKRKSKKSKNDDTEIEENEQDNNDETSSKMQKIKIPSYKNAEILMRNISRSEFKISDVTTRKSKRYPSAPFTTSTAQQDASTNLGFNVKKTMQCLQKLYEAGYTTYLRTDSTNLSKDALQQCTSHIKENFGDDYHNLKNYTNKKGNVQEAHEAIRPVDVSKKNVPIGGKIGQDEQKYINVFGQEQLHHR